MLAAKGGEGGEGGREDQEEAGEGLKTEGKREFLNKRPAERGGW